MPRTTQVFCATGLYGAAIVAAALDEDFYRPVDRRILVMANTAPSPETVTDFTALPGFARLRDRFDDVVSWNEFIAPFHPSGWSTRGDDSPIWERHLRRSWKLGADRLELVGDSIESGPAHALARMFPDAPVDLYAADLGAWGPTRVKLDPFVGTRIRRLIHPDLLPGLSPLLLSEFGVPAEVLPTAALLRTLAEPDAPRAAGAKRPAGPALLIGQYLSARGLRTEDQEEELYTRMVRGAVARGHRALVFAPHPAAPVRWSRRLEEQAALLDAELTVDTSALSAESLFQTLRPSLVVGSHSTALFTAAALYGLPVARVGTDALLAGLGNYASPERMTLTLADALLPDLEGPAAPAAASSWPAGPVGARQAMLRDAVAFCVQPQLYPGLRPAAESFLSHHLDAGSWRYFNRRRLASLVLPGAVPAQLAFIPRNPAVRRIARRAKALGRAQG